MKKILDGLTGMVQGMFVTLILGTVICQAGNLLGGDIGKILCMFGNFMVVLTGAGIGAGAAGKLEAGHLTFISAVVAGMAGAFASELRTGNLLSDGHMIFSGSGDTLGAFVAAFIAIEAGMLISNKTKLDIILVPVVSIGTGAAVSAFLSPFIMRLMEWICSLVSWGTQQQPLMMGAAVSVLTGMFITLPVSPAAVGALLNLSGPAAGAATVGCCCSMIGFAVAGWKDNGVAGLLVHGLGTSSLQFPNILKRPQIWIPVIVSSAVLGPAGTLLLHMTNNSAGAVMGTTALIGPLMSWQVMTQSEQGIIVFIKIIVIQFVLPAVLTLFVAEGMRKMNWIRSGDMKLER